MRCENKKNHYIIIILASIVVLRVSEIHRLSSVDCRVTLLSVVTLLQCEKSFTWLLRFKVSEVYLFMRELQQLFHLFVNKKNGCFG